MTTPQTYRNVPVIPNSLVDGLKRGDPGAVVDNADLYRAHASDVVTAASLFVGGDVDRVDQMLAKVTLARAGDESGLQEAFRELSAVPNSAANAASTHGASQTLLDHVGSIPCHPDLDRSAPSVSRL